MLILTNYDWINGTLSSVRYYYIKIVEDSIHVTSCFLGLTQLSKSIPNCALSLAITGISDASVSVHNYSI
jgi:hypothetical protein